MSTPVLFYWNDIQLVSQHAACKFLTDQKAVFFPVSHIENLKEIQQPMLWGGGGESTSLTWQWRSSPFAFGANRVLGAFSYIFSGWVIDGVKAKAKHVKNEM